MSNFNHLKKQTSSLYQKAWEFFHARPEKSAPVMILGKNGTQTPFSPTRLCRRLLLLMPTEEATTLSLAVQERLEDLGDTPIPASTVANITEDALKRARGAECAKRYRAWLNHFSSNRPLFILVGGISGSGKSTTAAEIASLLGIASMQSTDMVREVMRSMDASDPTLAVSSFQARSKGGSAEEEDPEVIHGFVEQARKVALAVDGVLRRAVKERVSLVLEGVHLHPAMTHPLPQGSDALMVQVMLSVLDPEKLMAHLVARGEAVPERGADRYLENFDAIWRIQMHLLAEASHHDIPVIQNDTLPQTVGKILDAVTVRLLTESGRN